MNIRKFETADRDSLIKLWQTVFPDDPLHNQPAAVIDAKLVVDDLIFVVEVDEKIAGACMAGYDGHRGWLYALAVYEEYRSAGIGAALVKQTLQSLKQAGCIKVNLQIRSTNKDVERFYQSLGFKTESRISMGVLI